MSLPARGAWIEIYIMPAHLIIISSLPARGAWIEILDDCLCFLYLPVAPRTGSVD